MPRHGQPQVRVPVLIIFGRHRHNPRQRQSLIACVVCERPAILRERPPDLRPQLTARRAVQGGTLGLENGLIDCRQRHAVVEGCHLASSVDRGLSRRRPRGRKDTALNGDPAGYGVDLLQQSHRAPSTEHRGAVFHGEPALGVAAGPICLISSHEILASEQKSPNDQPIACDRLVR